MSELSIHANPPDITGLILAGGQGSRFGGADKGLQLFHGQALALHALKRLTPQTGRMAISANRNLEIYRSWGAPVWNDESANFPGPLAGMLAGLTHCETPWLLTAACDSPLFPLDLAERLAGAATLNQSLVAYAAAPDETGQARPHPVFCLLHRSLRDSLASYLAQGSRRVMHWLNAQAHCTVNFDQPRDDPNAFANANTPEELLRLERISHQE